MRVRLLKDTYWPSCSLKNGDDFCNPLIVNSLPKGATGVLEYKYSIPFREPTKGKNNLYLFTPDDKRLWSDGNFMVIYPHVNFEGI